LKADNILVTNSPVLTASYAINAQKCTSLSEPLRIRRVWNMSPAAIWIKIIDFEISSQAGQTPENQYTITSSILENPGELEKLYGLSKVFSSVFDIHLMAFDILENAPNNEMKKEFFGFITAFIPAKYFYKENLTLNFRLRGEDQEHLEKKLQRHVLLEMLSHPYFFFLRGDANEQVDYEINYCN
jgi:hypothetical protein